MNCSCVTTGLFPPEEDWTFGNKVRENFFLFFMWRRSKIKGEALYGLAYSRGAVSPCILSIPGQSRGILYKVVFTTSAARFHFCPWKKRSFALCVCAAVYVGPFCLSGFINDKFKNIKFDPVNI